MASAAAKATSAADAAEYQPVTGYSWFVLAMLCLVYVFNFLDRQLLSILTEPIKADLNLSDAQIGWLGGLAFAACYTVIGIPVGWLADRTNRVRILALGCFLWSICTFASGRATSYPMLLAARAGVGVGEAGGAPPSYSIISDYFPPYRRGMALALFSLGVPFGQAVGIAFGAKVAELYDWRLAFIILGIAGAILSVIVVFVVREPKRGRMDVKINTRTQEALPVAIEAEERASFVRTMRDFFGRPVLLFAALSCGAAAFVSYAILNWTTPFLMRDKGMTLGEIAIYYSIFTAVFTGLGTWMAGDLVDRLAKRSKVWYALVPAIAFGVAIPFYVGFVLAPTWKIALMFLAVPAFCNIFYLAPALAVVQNHVKPNQRTMSGAMLLFVLNMVGLGFGPTFVGTMSTAFVPQYGVESLQMALLWLTPFYAAAVGTHLVSAWALKDEIANGAPNQDQIDRNLMLVKLAIGAILLVIINVMTIKHPSVYWVLTVVFGVVLLLGVLDFLRRSKAKKAAL